MKKIVITLLFFNVFSFSANADWQAGIDDSRKLLNVLSACGSLKDSNRAPNFRLVKMTKDIVENRISPTADQVAKLEDLTITQAYCGMLYDFILKDADKILEESKNLDLFLEQ